MGFIDLWAKSGDPFAKAMALQTLPAAGLAELMLRARRNIANPQPAIENAVNTAWIDPRQPDTDKAIEVGLNYGPGIAGMMVGPKNGTAMSVPKTLYRGVRDINNQSTPGLISNKGVESGLHWTEDESLAKYYAGEKGTVLSTKIPKNAKILELVDRNGDINKLAVEEFEKITGEKFDYFRMVEKGISGYSDKLKSAGYDAVQSPDIDGIETLILNKNIINNKYPVLTRKTSSFWKEMQDVAYQPGHPKQQLYDDLNSVLVNHPAELTFNPDTGRLMGSVARDSNFAMKGDRGTYSLKKQDFLDWLFSDKPFDEKVYGKDIKQNAEWIASIERLRSALK